MRYTLKRDDIPLLSQWIKKFDKPKLVEFFGRGRRTRSHHGLRKGEWISPFLRGSVSRGSDDRSGLTSENIVVARRGTALSFNSLFS